VFQFAAEHQTQLLYGLYAVLACALLIAGYIYFSQRAEKSAQIRFEQLMARYESLSEEKDPAEIYRDISSDFKNLIDKHGNRRAGSWARMTYANICYEAGEYREAIDQYQSVLKDFEGQPLIYYQILSSLGYAFEQIGDREKAVSYFERIQSAAVPFLLDEALFKLGLLYEDLGRIEKSRAAFQQVVSNHPDSIYFEMVKERLAS
jgi:tetratricopeptide (TPR) repeat protein